MPSRVVCGCPRLIASMLPTGAEVHGIPMGRSRLGNVVGSANEIPKLVFGLSECPGENMKPTISLNRSHCSGLDQTHCSPRIGVFPVGQHFPD